MSVIRLPQIRIGFLEEEVIGPEVGVSVATNLEGATNVRSLMVTE